MCRRSQHYMFAPCIASTTCLHHATTPSLTSCNTLGGAGSCNAPYMNPKWATALCGVLGALQGCAGGGLTVAQGPAHSRFARLAGLPAQQVCQAGQSINSASLSRTKFSICTGSDSGSCLIGAMGNCSVSRMRWAAPSGWLPRSRPSQL
jgi:hypothetical protein